MTKDSLLAKTLKILTGRNKAEGFRASDLAGLQVALMVAALDGKVLPEEFKSFERLAKKCEGATEEKVAKALDAALRVAGYVLLQSFRLSPKALAALFADEAEKLLPKNFLSGRPGAVRSALTMWLTIAMSDGDFSGIERSCLEGLFRRLRGTVYETFLAAGREACSHTRVYVSERDLIKSANLRTEDFLPIDFLAKTETALAALAHKAAAEGADGLRTLIG